MRTLRSYPRSALRPDLVAGVVLAAILVPQGMAYAQLAGLPPVTGLYTTIACLVGYALFGPSRVLVLGPDSSISPLILASITPLLAGGSEGKAIALAGMLAVLVGLTEIGLGLGKLGFVGGPPLQGGPGRLHERPRHHDHRRAVAEAVRLLDRRRLIPEGDPSLLRRPLRTDATTLVVGVAVLVVLLVVPRITTRLPAVLVAVVGVTAISAALDLAGHGVATVGSLPKGVPSSTFPWTDAKDVGPLLIAAVGITLVSLTDTIATATSFAARRGDEVQPDQEMIGMGAANIAAGLFQGFAVSTSGSRTAVAEQSGAKTQFTGLSARVWWPRSCCS